MEVQIKNGSNGNVATVDEQGRVHAFSISETLQEEASVKGDSYNINTGSMAFSNDLEAGVLYLKNNGDRNIVVVSIGLLMGNSTAGTGDALLTVLRNPTTGTVVSDQIAPAINVNKNFGSSKTLPADVYKGGQGKTFTDGTDAYYSLLPGAARSYAISTGGIQLPKGSSVGIKLTPPTGNTSMNAQVFLAVIEVDKS